MVSLPSEDYSIKTSWTCLAEKKDVFVNSFIKEPNQALRLLFWFLSNRVHVYTAGANEVFYRAADQLQPFCERQML